MTKVSGEEGEVLTDRESHGGQLAGNVRTHCPGAHMVIPGGPEGAPPPRNQVRSGQVGVRGVAARNK